MRLCSSFLMGTYCLGDGTTLPHDRLTNGPVYLITAYVVSSTYCSSGFILRNILRSNLIRVVDIAISDTSKIQLGRLKKHKVPRTKWPTLQSSPTISWVFSTILDPTSRHSSCACAALHSIGAAGWGAIPRWLLNRCSPTIRSWWLWIIILSPWYSCYKLHTFLLPSTCTTDKFKTSPLLFHSLLESKTHIHVLLQKKNIFPTSCRQPEFSSRDNRNTFIVWSICS